jgi:hypothetical protein
MPVSLKVATNSILYFGRFETILLTTVAPYLVHRDQHWLFTPVIADIQTVLRFFSGCHGVFPT